MQDFVIPDPNLPWERELLIGNLLYVLGAALGAFLFAVLTLRYILPKLSRKIHGPYLEATLADARIHRAVETAISVGRKGTAMTLLRPSGIAMINDRRYDVVTRGEFLEKGTPIRVVKAKGARIVVAQADKEE
jgi:membrane-bound serine protease (ClpP class)